MGELVSLVTAIVTRVSVESHSRADCPQCLQTSLSAPYMMNPTSHPGGCRSQLYQIHLGPLPRDTGVPRHVQTCSAQHSTHLGVSPNRHPIKHPNKTAAFPPGSEWMSQMLETKLPLEYKWASTLTKGFYKSSCLQPIYKLSSVRKSDNRSSTGTQTLYFQIIS